MVVSGGGDKKYVVEIRSGVSINKKVFYHTIVERNIKILAPSKDFAQFLLKSKVHELDIIIIFFFSPAVLLFTPKYLATQRKLPPLLLTNQNAAFQA